VKRLGIIGGIAPASTVQYYEMLVAAYREQAHDKSYPAILINSIDLSRLVALVTGNRLAELTVYLRNELERLANAGADFGLLASNTPHIVFAELSRTSPIPLISIVEAACQATRALGLRRVALLGTRYTMEGSFYPDVFTTRGIAVFPPSAGDRSYVHEKYMGELIEGDFRSETRAGVSAVIHRLKEAGAEGVLLAGTEPPLLLRGTQDWDIPLLDTARIHVQRAVAELLSST